MPSSPDRLLERMTSTERHVLEGRIIVNKQMAPLNQLRGHGANVARAERQLQLFLETLSIFENNRQTLQHEFTSTEARQNSPLAISTKAPSHLTKKRSYLRLVNT